MERARSSVMLCIVLDKSQARVEIRNLKLNVLDKARVFRKAPPTMGAGELRCQQL